MAVRWSCCVSITAPDDTGVPPTTVIAFAAGGTLELAIGTGRVALPLAARGVTVEGIDASAAMVEQMRAKAGGATIAAGGPARAIKRISHAATPTVRWSAPA